MIDIELLKKIQSVTGINFAVIENRECFKFLTMEKIPITHILHQTMPTDGTYILLKNTCGECEIGKPLQKCINGRVYSKEKCSVYRLEELDNLKITYKQLTEIIKKKAGGRP